MSKTLEEIMYISDGNNPFRENLIYGKGGLGYKPYLGINGSGLDESDEYKKVSSSKLYKMPIDELNSLIMKNNDDINAYENDERGFLSENADDLKQELIKNLKDENIEIISILNDIFDKENYINERNKTRDDYIKRFNVEGIPFFNALPSYFKHTKEFNDILSDRVQSSTNSAQVFEL
jgi:hypothetical protein